MNDILARVWGNLYARLTGPMNLRLIIQPTVATILAIRAQLDRPPCPVPPNGKPSLAAVPYFMRRRPCSMMSFR